MIINTVILAALYVRKTLCCRFYIFMYCRHKAKCLKGSMDALLEKSVQSFASALGVNLKGLL